MYVCLCHAITDTQIRTAVAEGVTSMRELRQRLGVCSSCGKCGPCAQRMLRERQASAPSLANDNLVYVC